MQTHSASVQTIGQFLRHWRQHRRFSQMDLAGMAEVSPRHLSCLETGKAKPSQQMVLVLASALELPLRDRNRMLQLAGYAPVYRSLDLEAPELAQVRAALDHLLAAQEPYGAVVVDRLWNVKKANRPFTALWTAVTGQELDGVNLLRAMFNPRVRPMFSNFDDVAAATLDRLGREAAAADDAAMRELFDELQGLAGALPVPSPSATPALFLPMTLTIGDVSLALFTTITTLGTPIDVTLAELRIESYFPANPATADWLRANFATQP